MPDFKEQEIYLPSFPALFLKPEGHEIQESDAVSEKTSASMKSWARVYSLIFAGDSMDVLSLPAIGQGIASAVNATINARLATVLESADLAETSGSMDATGLGAGFQSLRDQTDQAGNDLGLVPAAIVVPSTSEVAARTLMAGWPGAPKVVVLPGLAAGSFYVASDPLQQASFAILTMGDLTPEISTRLDFRTDILKIKVITHFEIAQTSVKGVVRVNA
ncbi:MAG: hypothetical protein EOM25_08815 [Deltaproteobacteria bacterium]|nr:hypothetical protein [Deltaproteobacteria bacterium]